MRGPPSASPTTPIGGPPTTNFMAPPVPAPSGGQPAASSQGAQGPQLHTFGDVVDQAKTKKMKQEPQDQPADAEQVIDITLQDAQKDPGDQEPEKTIAELEEEAQLQKEL